MDRAKLFKDEFEKFLSANKPSTSDYCSLFRVVASVTKSSEGLTSLEIEKIVAKTLNNNDGKTI